MSFKYAPECAVCPKCGVQYTDVRRAKCPHNDPEYRVPEWYSEGWAPVVGSEMAADEVSPAAESRGE